MSAVTFKQLCAAGALASLAVLLNGNFGMKETGRSGLTVLLSLLVYVT